MCSGLLEMLKETSELTDGGWRWRFHWKTGGRVAYSKPFAGTSINKLLIIKDESLFMIERRCTQPPLPVPSIYTPPLASLHTPPIQILWRHVTDCYDCWLLGNHHIRSLASELGWILNKVPKEFISRTSFFLPHTPVPPLRIDGGILLRL